MKDKLREDLRDALIYAGDQYTNKYKDDDRQDIKTDVLNAFYQGANWMRISMRAALQSIRSPAEHENSTTGVFHGN